MTTTDSVLDGTMMVQEIASTNGGAPSTATYLVGPRGPEYRKDANGVKWYSYDGLGSVLGEVDLNGNLTATRSYDVYGAKRTTGGTQSTNHGFVGSLGHPSEDSTGMIYMRARYMDPAVGRFVSQDHRHQGGNWFAYVNNSPTAMRDASGTEYVWINHVFDYASEEFREELINAAFRGAEALADFLESAGYPEIARHFSYIPGRAGAIFGKLQLRLKVEAELLDLLTEEVTDGLGQTYGEIIEIGNLVEGAKSAEVVDMETTGSLGGFGL